MLLTSMGVSSKEGTFVDLVVLGCPFGGSLLWTAQVCFFFFLMPSRLRVQAFIGIMPPDWAGMGGVLALWASLKQPGCLGSRIQWSASS